MPIKVSTARRVDALLDDLRADDPLLRDAAVAQLTVIGERAVDRLVALADDASASASARAAAFRALEGIGDPRALPPALRTLAAPAHISPSGSPDVPPEVAIAALGVARGFLPSDRAGLTVLDALTRTALDTERRDAVREAALRALFTLDASMVGPVVETLLTDPSARIRTLAQGTAPESTEPAAASESWLDRGDDAALPADAEAARHEIARRGSSVSLPHLLRAIERIRERESQVPTSQQRAWLAARAAAHRVLAQRGSRIALYDLREILEHAEGPMPWSDVLGAVAAIGDTSCLERLAALYASTAAPSHPDAWHRQLVDAFRAIVAREKITLRHAAAKKIKQRWPDRWAELWSSPA